MTTALKQAKVYDAAALQLRIQVSKQLAKQSSSSTQIDQQAIDKATKEVLTAKLVEDNLTPIIDSGYSWLNGDVTEPKIAVDTKQVQDRIVANIADSAAKRVEGLPACTSAQLVKIDPNAIDPFSLVCQPPDLSPEEVRQEFITQASSSTETDSKGGLLGAAQANDGSIVEKGVFEQYSAVPAVFQTLKFLPWILGIILGVAIWLAIKLSPTNTKGLNKLSTYLILTGASLIAIIFIGKYLQTMAYDQIGIELGHMKDSVIDATEIMNSIFYKTLLLVAAVGLLAGALGVLLPKCFNNQPKHKKVA